MSHEASNTPLLLYQTFNLLSSDTWSSFTPVTLQDIRVLLCHIKQTSSPLDVLPSSFFTSVFDSVGPCIVEMINTSLHTGSVPSFFKQAVVEPILKKPQLDPSLPNSYRPISKLPFISKILEKVVLEQLNYFLDKNAVMDTFQSGFRKFHSTETALLRVSSDILMAADSGEYTVLVLLDLSSAFDTVDHSIMINRLKNLFGITGVVLKWFISYLSERSFTVCMNHVTSESTVLPCGVPQGSVLGPILFLLYVFPLGQIIKRYKYISYHLYADDIQLYCSFKMSEFYKLSNLSNCLTEINKWLYDNFLQLNSDKTETLIIAPDHMVPEIRQHISFLEPYVKSSLRNLGVIFDSSMSLEQHSKQLVRNCFYHLRNISKLRLMVSKPELEMIIHAFISSRLDYCNGLFTCFNKSALSRLQTVQNAAARLLTGTKRRSHITPVLASLHWLPVNFRFHFKILVLTFRALHGQAPQYLSDLLKPHTPSRALRSLDQRLLVVPRTRFKTRGDRAFQTVAPRLWNSLPLSLRCTDSIDSFKKQLKTFLFRKAFD
uniref:Reverse transcriptase domain-containing protein n=1 Tax=Oreochromis niloticus TaxID=8128 RepID=A0A669E4F5_ORENI